MKAMSIQQPWVHVILHNGKDVENRRWRSDFRGWIALHASAKATPFDEPRGIRIPDLKTLDYSAICGVARVVDVVSKSRSKWFAKPDEGDVNYGWVLEDVTPLKTPIPCKGALKLWNVPPAVLRQIRRQLPRIEFDE